MYVLYVLKLKLYWRRNAISKSFYCANEPYTTGLKFKLLRGQNEDFKINQGRIMTLTQQRRYLSLTRNSFYIFFLQRMVK